MPHTEQQVNAAINIMFAVRDAIRDAGPNGIPDGHVYAACMNVMSLHTYQQLIDKLVSIGVVRKSNHVLYWIEP